MKRNVLRLLIILVAVLMLTVSVLGVSYGKVASSADMTTVEEVGFDGLIPVYAEDIENGIAAYDPQGITPIDAPEEKAEETK